MLQFFHIQVSFRVLFPGATLSHFLKKVRTVAAQRRIISKDICDGLH